MTGSSPATRPIHLLLTTDVVGGVWDFCWALASELIGCGNRVTLLALGSPSSEQRHQATEVGLSLLDAPLKLEWMQDGAVDVRTAQELATQLVSELKPDVLHVNQYALAQLSVSVPVVLTAHSDVLSWQKWTSPESQLWSPGRHDYSSIVTRDSGLHAYAALVRRGLEAADTAVAVSRFLASELRELYRVKRELLVIHNGWPAGESQGRAVHERPRLTLLAGRAWDSAKNIQLAAVAARGWASGRILLAGEQRHPESGGCMQLDPPIEPLGRMSRDQVDRLLGEARVYLSPARYEPFGLLPLQAALAGCSLLLSDLPSFRELWNGAAVFFRADDVADLRRKWARLLEDQEQAAELAACAWQIARERYSATRMAAAYASVYSGLLAGERTTGKRPAARVLA